MSNILSPCSPMLVHGLLRQHSHTSQYLAMLDLAKSLHLIFHRPGNREYIANRDTGWHIHHAVMLTTLLLASFMGNVRVIDRDTDCTAARMPNITFVEHGMMEPLRGKNAWIHGLPRVALRDPGL